MKNTVLKYGFISGAICALLLLVTGLFHDKISFDYGMLVGYAGMVIAFIVIYPALVSYRDKVGNGYISFGRGMGVGMLIVLVSSICYVITWLIVLNTMLPDFADQYTAYALESMQKAGKSAAQIDAKMKEMAEFKELYKNPLAVAAFTFLEPLPVGVLITLISALIVKARGKKNMLQTA